MFSWIPLYIRSITMGTAHIYELLNYWFFKKHWGLIFKILDKKVWEVLTSEGFRIEQSPFEPVLTFVDLSIMVLGDE